MDFHRSVILISGMPCPSILGPAQNTKGTPCVSRFGPATIAYAPRLAIIFHRFGEIPLSRARPPRQPNPHIWDARPSDPPILGSGQNTKGTPWFSRFGPATIAYAPRLAIIFHRFGEIPLSRAGLPRQPNTHIWDARPSYPPILGAAQNTKGTPWFSRFGPATIAYAPGLAIIFHRFGEIPLSRAGPPGQPNTHIWDAWPSDPPILGQPYPHIWDPCPVHGPIIASSRGPEMGPGMGPGMGPDMGPEMGPKLEPEMGPEMGPEWYRKWDRKWDRMLYACMHACLLAVCMHASRGVVSITHYIFPVVIFDIWMIPLQIPPVPFFTFIFSLTPASTCWVNNGGGAPPCDHEPS